MQVPALVIAGLLLPAVPAAADSWLPPRPQLASSQDGRWYVIVAPSDEGARFQLVERAAGRPAREAPYVERGFFEKAPALEPDPGDRVAVEGTLGWMPMEVRCLDGGRGFVPFETYGHIGYGTVLERRDAKGEPRWTHRLGDLFDDEQVARFTRTVSSIWWYEGVWVDEAAADVVVAWAGKAKERGILRVALETGARRAGKPADLLAFLGRGSADARITALSSAQERDVEGLLPAVEAAFGDAAAPLLARLHFAVHMQAAGDPRGRPLIVEAAQPGQRPDVREYAVRHLARFVAAAEAIPLLAEALRSEHDPVWRAGEEGLRKLGSQAVEALAAMILDEEESERFRAGAATALWNMGAPAAPALPALEKAAKSGLEKLAYAAGHAIEHIREVTRGK